MCGICGWIGKKSNADAVKIVQTMNDTLSHRGPDGEGVTQEKNVILAMRRLAIIDPEGGKQPLFNEDSSIAIVGNGELYNYKNLKKRLQKKGHLFRTGSDIEVFVHLYEEYGTDAVKKVHGMFALALHDRRKNLVYLFRDRLGEKPLYYTHTGDNLYFSSELKSLLTAPFERSIDPVAIDNFFHFYYVPEPQTPFSQVHKLPAGSYMEVRCRTLKTRIVQYWDLQSIPVTNSDNPTEKIKATFLECTTEALVSDVPIAISLSGGIDSSAIAAVAADSTTLTALSVGYANASKYDERSAARAFSQQIEIEHLSSQIDDKSIIKDFPKLVWDCDDLIAEVGMFNINAIYRETRKHGFTVLLSGVGGDELFWGYPWVRKVAIHTEQKMKLHFKKFYRTLRNKLPDTLKNTKSYKKFLGSLNYLISPLEQLVLSDTRPAFIGAENFIHYWYGARLKNKISQVERLRFLQFRHTGDESEIGQRIMQLISKRWLTSHVIAINDRLSMANGVEVRLPLVDFRLFETVMKHKKSLAAYKKPHKFYFKAALASILPAQLMEKKKKGFTPPVARWVFAIIFHYRRLLRNGFVVKEGFIDKKFIYVLPIFMLFPQTWMLIFQVLVLEVWGRLYVWNQSLDDIVT